jgi:hypothetical protein
VNIELLERAAVALGELVEDVMFVGGATIELWLTDPGAIDIRPTLDVDVVVEITSRLAFHDFAAELRRRGFAEGPSKRGHLPLAASRSESDARRDARSRRDSRFREPLAGSRAATRGPARTPVRRDDPGRPAAVPLGDEARGLPEPREG